VTDKPFFDSKTKLDWFRSIVVAAFVVGTLWATLNSRLKAVEEGLADKPSNMEFEYIKKKVDDLEMDIKDTPSSMELKPMQDSLRRIERELGDIGPRLRGMEKDVAVIKATKSSSTHSGFQKSYIGDVE